VVTSKEEEKEEEKMQKKIPEFIGDSAANLWGLKVIESSILPEDLTLLTPDGYLITRDIENIENTYMRKTTWDLNTTRIFSA
jgi:hypothetical protein